MKNKRMMAQLIFILALAFSVTSFPVVSPAATTAWTFGEIDAPKYFTRPESRAIAVERTTNRPHIVYGRDALYHAYRDGTGWQYETIADAPETLGNISVTLDAFNKVFTCFVEDDILKYATNASGSWVVEDVANLIGGGYTSIAVDSAGNIHIAYEDWASSSTNYPKKIMYATNASGSWVTANLTTNGRYPDIAMDSNDKAHIVYVYNYSSSYTQTGYLRYATNVSGTWSTIYVFSDDKSLHHSSLAIDGDDNVHIGVIRDYTINYNPQDDLYYVTNASGSWSTQFVASGRADYSSIAVDSNAAAHISYHDTSNQNLKYATNASGVWVLSTLDSTGDTGYGTSIAADSANRLHIAYLDRTSGTLKYTTNTPGSFGIIDIDQTRTSGNHSALAIDGNGKMHLSASYGDGSGGALKYLTNTSGSWAGTIVDSSSGDTGSYTSIAMDSSGKAHISYKDGANKDLKYATNASGNWAAEIVDPEDGVGTAIAIDTGNKAHISYRTISGAKYATNAGGPWAIETVGSASSLASSDQTDIALDSNSDAHVVYSASGIYYATNATGTWVTTALETSYSTWPSLAVDSVDNIHVVYGRSGSLTYATNASGSWVKTTLGSGYGINSITVDSGDHLHIVSGSYYFTNSPGSWYSSYSPDFGSYGSIALDSADTIYISFYNQYLGDLLYATSSDPVAPAGTILINADDPYTDSSSVSLTLTCDDGTGSGCTEVQFVNTNVNRDWSPWEAYGTPKPWTLLEFDGTRRVYAKFKDAQGNWSNAYSDTIILDTEPPVVQWLRINDDAVSTTSTAVTLTYSIGETSEVTEMCFSNTGTCSLWEPYETTREWMVSGGDGTKTVSAWFKDAFGQITTTAATDSILLDTSAPTGAVTIDSGSAYTNLSSVALAISATDATDVFEMCISNSGTCTAWEAYTASTTWTLGSGDGTKTVRVWLRDSLGNQSASPLTDDIVYDTAEPSGSIMINQGALYTYTPAVNLYFSSMDLSGVAEMCVSNTIACASWEAYAPIKSWLLNAGNDVQTVFVRFRDNVGNENSNPFYDSIVLDQSDSDDDSMPDLWEEDIVDYDPTDDITDILDVLSDDDFDGDGFTNLEEYQAGTDPSDSTSKPARGMPWIPLLLLDE